LRTTGRKAAPECNCQRCWRSRGRCSMSTTTRPVGDAHRHWTHRRRRELKNLIFAAVGAEAAHRPRRRDQQRNRHQGEPRLRLDLRPPAVAYWSDMRVSSCHGGRHAAGRPGAPARQGALQAAASIPGQRG
jgi:hypothetical protein